MGQVELSIIIINYKTPTLTLQCLESIYSNTTNVKFEVIVVDNFSEDNIFDLIRRKFPETKCIQMNYNSGFARANNVGIKESCGDYILFLNSGIITSVIGPILAFGFSLYNSKTLNTEVVSLVF